MEYRTIYPPLNIPALLTITTGGLNITGGIGNAVAPTTDELTRWAALRGIASATSLTIAGHVTGGAPAQRDIVVTTGNAANPQVNTTRLTISSNVATAVWTFANSNFLMQPGTGGPSPDSLLHLWDSNAGTVTALVGTLLTLETGGAATNISLLGTTAANKSILFGEPGANGEFRGIFRYYGSTATPADTFEIATATAIRLRYSATAFAFQEATTISTTTGALTLSPTTEVVISSGARAKVGGTAAHATTPGTNIISLFLGTIPVGTLASGGSLYVATATNVELNYIDSAGNAQQLSTT